MALEIPIIKEIVTVPLSAGDERLSEIFDISPNLAGDIRREMKWFPKYSKGLQNSGVIVDIAIFREYFTYRGTPQWKKEWEEIKNRRKK